MGFCVLGGAMCTCSFGMAPSTLMVTAGKKDGIVHAGGDDHGSRADEKYYALRNVSVHGESGCGSGDGCGIRSLNSDAMHSGDPGAVVTGITRQFSSEIRRR